jgi:hypothetical protein
MKKRYQTKFYPQKNQVQTKPETKLVEEFDDFPLLNNYVSGRDVVVIPKDWDTTKFSNKTQNVIRHIESQNKLLRLNFIYTPAIVRN